MFFKNIFHNIVESHRHIKFGIKNENWFVIKTKIPQFLPFYVYSFFFFLKQDFLKLMSSTEDITYE